MPNSADITPTAATQQQRGGYPFAEYVTGVKRTTLTSMVCRKQVHHHRLGPRLVVFDRAELESWMAQRRVPVKHGR